MKISTLWFRDCKTQQERDKRETLVRENQGFLNALAAIVQAEIVAIETSGDYDATWALREADRAGQRRAFKKVLDLTKVT